MPHWSPAPTEVQVFRDHGTGDMGSLAYGTGSDTNQAARFKLPRKFVLSSIRAHFNAGVGENNLVVNLDSSFGPQFDVKLKTITGVGTGGEDVNFRIPADEHIHWIFDGTRGDELVLTWTNPDSGTMQWAVEVGLIPVEGV